MALLGLGATIGATGVATAGSGGEATAAAAAGGGEPRAEAAARKRKVVRVRDNFFSPARMRVRRGTLVVWGWPRRNVNRHNVVLRRAPRGVRRFRSKSAVSGYRFARRLRKPGRYRLICRFHANMEMGIRVLRRR